MDDADSTQELSIEVVYSDEHLIQLEAIVSTDGWRGRARAYTGAPDIAAFAAALSRFANGEQTSVGTTAGDDSGIGLIALRFYRIDRAGHLAGHIALASDVPDDHRPEQISRLAVEFSAEVWSLTKFAAELCELARTQSGRAAMTVNERG